MKGPARFLESVAMPLVDELRSIEALKTFTTNPDVIGAHAEAAVRKFVARVVELAAGLGPIACFVNRVACGLKRQAQHLPQTLFIFD